MVPTSRASSLPYWVKMAKAVAGNIGVDQTHDAEGSKIDDPAHDLGDRTAVFAIKVLVVSELIFFMATPEHAGPEQDADVVGRS